ncbi:hypothetical protein, partial [Acidiphilium sp. MT5]
ADQNRHHIDSRQQGQRNNAYQTTTPACEHGHPVLALMPSLNLTETPNASSFLNQDSLCEIYRRSFGLEAFGAGPFDEWQMACLLRSVAEPQPGFGVLMPIMLPLPSPRFPLGN